ncbi:PREDICTED: T-cell activation Rho GTPase-activating protein [Elephantulus edwardii]|uniref:T-cell activation Rho GTPase-activating protein n=1 Tax=Elephantulus edwardii TaxID=28737 RepID=UPI0003F09E1E|nr:PREDICTED: T-cell activation Rho GTPase-activating protein [Elephantulus edwardii]
MKVTSSCHASKTLNVNGMETFGRCQSEGDIKEHPLLASCESEDSTCQLIEIKKRKKTLAWSSLMRKLSPSSDFSGALEPELKASLFDQPLSSICGEDHTLPRPIQDILAVLCLKGPSTEGIFRKAANEKARKELKEALNAGGNVHLEDRPVHLLAAVFKDFLRSIPGKLLSSELFEDWMDALDGPNEEDRIEALKEVAGRLPRPNLVLLKHLASVLYLISKNSGTNKMDPSNLAICIGPNVLALENDRSLSLEAQKDLNNKVKMLVEFLIENCLEVFGENVPAPSSVTSDDSLEHTDSSDVSTLQNDSAYESTDPEAEASSVTSSPSSQPTETEANTDNSGPPSPCESGLKPRPIPSTVARLKTSLSQADRRHSEPSMSSSRAYLESRMTSHKLTKSEDNFPMTQTGAGFGKEDTDDLFPEEVFPGLEGQPKRPEDLKPKSVTPGPGFPRALVAKAMFSASWSGSSDSIPRASPSSPSPQRNFFTRHQSFIAKTEKTTAKASREIKKHSLSFSWAPHKASGSRAERHKGFPRDQGKPLRKESQLAGRIVQESWSEAHSQPARDSSSRACGLSVDDVFQHVDQRVPGSPPSYEEAVQCQAFELADYKNQTVGNMRARMLSLDSVRPALRPSRQEEGSTNTGSHGPLTRQRPSPLTGSWEQSGTMCVNVESGEAVAVPGRSALHRLRTESETLPKTKKDYLLRRCSQPVFEVGQLQYTRESYI